MILAAALEQQLLQAAHRASPHEVCGLLAGDGERITHAFPVSNIAASPKHAFEMHPIETLQALKQMDVHGLKPMGLYHSHPQSDALPSQADIHAHLRHHPQWLHMIIAVKPRPHLRLWRITPISVEEVREQAPSYFTANSQATLMLTAFLSALLMIAWAISLLPPAPVLPAPMP